MMLNIPYNPYLPIEKPHILVVGDGTTASVNKSFKLIFEIVGYDPNVTEGVIIAPASGQTTPVSSGLSSPRLIMPESGDRCDVYIAGHTTYALKWAVKAQQTTIRNKHETVIYDGIKFFTANDKDIRVFRKRLKIRGIEYICFHIKLPLSDQQTSFNILHFEVQNVDGSFANRFPDVDFTKEDPYYLITDIIMPFKKCESTGRYHVKL